MAPTVRRTSRAPGASDRAVHLLQPPRPGIDRATYFQRCWPNAELIESFEFKRLVEAGDEVFVTYESAKTDGKRFRNTEVLTFEGDKIRRAELYFGWDLE